jgi:hypothetical protein
MACTSHLVLRSAQSLCMGIRIQCAGLISCQCVVSAPCASSSPFLKSIKRLRRGLPALERSPDEADEMLLLLFSFSISRYTDLWSKYGPLNMRDTNFRARVS